MIHMKLISAIFRIKPKPLILFVKKQSKKYFKADRIKTFKPRNFVIESSYIGFKPFMIPK